MCKRLLPKHLRDLRSFVVSAFSGLAGCQRYLHPHVDSSGRPCLGNILADLARLPRHLMRPGGRDCLFGIAPTSSLVQEIVAQPVL